MSETRIKTGDHVLHRESGETWVIAFADYDSGHLAWCGWPPGMAKISDCDLVKVATEDERAELIGRLLKLQGDFRGDWIRRRHQPLPDKRTEEAVNG